ncbi:D-alanine--D-alanine ligase family protein [Natranaerobius thermophilus]|uniref:D-alanine--D-alanine ligase n=1 Tax=Natranaerobius thermophilus (strain ATCC BAA-1301 / DSM 18059 / JW/NM-WN-LF) TaxID=457570 RepID=DDL_NATTJ|nr:D-alanine--D-alanine ligase family protein [Natranaerobius thermophilus]B2A2Z6.1 RecName: Full=D-alanine--D-alanine ligase; AltName: Full=D-Ala-D-Ala ligase; AltName: Full=D-alanylalanine synthetase [Natranaerobius thermophilus JW/NM-WN-LF]ACB83610.1 D-alanine--D-alanine ligase [Natranaerobius thermophilus JW/NM-WN-LF]
MKKLRVGVLFGGRSGEHEVSLKSANSILNALDRELFEVIPIGIRKNGEWISGEAPLEELETGIKNQGNYAVSILPDPSKKVLWKLDPFEKISEIDLIFPVLHGTFGEDGTVQGFLDLCGIPYVGSGVLGSSLAMDKVMMKKILRRHGLQVANYYSFKRSEWEQDRDEIIFSIEKQLSYPIFVKPANLGSSVGISKVKNREELIQGIDLAVKYDMKCLAEEFIPGKEIELSILGNDNPKTSVPGEIIPANEFYDYNAKYINNKSKLVIPAPLSETLKTKIEDMGVEAFRVLDCYGLSRVDYFVLEDQEEVYINEINTMPGFTEISMYPKLWTESGLSYSQLLTDLIYLALARQQEKDRNSTDFSES